MKPPKRAATVSAFSPSQYSRFNKRTPQKMATKSLSDRTSCPNLDMDLFECGICTDDLSIPKSLPCLHNFCQDCLLTYFKTNDIKEDASFLCPVCRADTVVPEGGARKFPTNFHIENLWKRRSSLDFGYTIRDAMQFWDNSEEEVVEQLNERKRRIMIDVNARREEIIAMLDAYIEGMNETMEDKYVEDSCKAVDIIQKAKMRFTELQACIEPNNDSHERNQEDVWGRLKRQGETMSNLANEIEEIKSTTDSELAKILRSELSFESGTLPAKRLQYYFGSLVKRVKRKDKTVIDYIIHNGQISVLTFLNWSQSWHMLLLGIIPALVLAVAMHVLYMFMKE